MEKAWSGLIQNKQINWDRDVRSRQNYQITWRDATKQKPEPNENRDRNRVKQSDVRSPCCNPHVSEREDQSFKGNFQQRESHKGMITTIRRLLLGWDFTRMRYAERPLNHKECMLVSLATLQDPRSAESPSETIGSKNRLLHPSRAARPVSENLLI